MTDSNTISTLTRQIANLCRKSPNGVSAISVTSTALGSKKTVDSPYVDLAYALEAIADRIDTELEAARETKTLSRLDAVIAKQGWPDRRDDESMRRYIERCFLPRPRFEDGEPVQIGDKIFSFGAERIVGRIIVCIDSENFEVLHSSSNGDEKRIKRPVPEVMGADGLPIKVGETVYWTDDTGSPGEEYIVDRIERDESCTHDVQIWNVGGHWMPPELLTHTKPDTQEAIEADAARNYLDYWGCHGKICQSCPVAEGGDRPPYERYGLSYGHCRAAMSLDLLRRQRELDSRTMGGEAR